MCGANPAKIPMISPIATTADSPPTSQEGEAVQSIPIPRYLAQVYWWAYVHPRAVHVFERRWLVNAILFGNYGRLRDAALAELGETVRGSTLQLACVYGDLTPRLYRRLAPDARLDIVDILAVQLENLGQKLTCRERVTLMQADTSSLTFADSSYDHVLLFFLLHEQPEPVRRKTLAEAMRVIRPGGKVVIVEYHRPSRWHVMRPLLRLVFRKLEPYAMDLWKHGVEAFLPNDVTPASVEKRLFFGGLYQKLTLVR